MAARAGACAIAAWRAGDYRAHLSTRSSRLPGHAEHAQGGVEPGAGPGATDRAAPRRAGAPRARDERRAGRFTVRLPPHGCSPSLVSRGTIPNRGRGA